MPFGEFNPQSFAKLLGLRKKTATSPPQLLPKEGLLSWARKPFLAGLRYFGFMLSAVSPLEPPATPEGKWPKGADEARRKALRTLDEQSVQEVEAYLSIGPGGWSDILGLGNGREEQTRAALIQYLAFRKKCEEDHTGYFRRRCLFLLGVAATGIWVRPMISSLLAEKHKTKGPMDL